MQISGNTAIAYFEFMQGMNHPAWKGNYRQLWAIAYRRARCGLIQF